MKDWKTELYRKVIKEAAQHQIRLQFTFNAYGTAECCLNDNDKVQIRVSVVTGTKPEHEKGLERFNVSQNIRNCSFIIFAIENSGDLITYIFRSSDINNIKSLNLRFSDESKYQIKRKSKYDYAKENWGILK